MMKRFKRPAGFTQRDHWTRREALRAGALTAASMMIPLDASARTIARLSSPFDRRGVRHDQSEMRTLALAAIDAARAAGAQYAEARVTRTVTQLFDYRSLTPISPERPGFLVSDDEELAMGVRVLFDGGWGFAGTPYWNADESVRIAREATMQARANARAIPREVELGTYPVAKGSWTTPGLDPFAVPIEEKIDFMQALASVFQNRRREGQWRQFVIGGDINLYRQERFLATTEGALVSQTVFRTGGSAGAGVEPPVDKKRRRSVNAQGLMLSGAGWELFPSAKLDDQLPELVEQARILVDVPEKPVEIGRYDIVFDAPTMARLVDATLGRATQLDRALGYEANASGTSYLGPDPLEHLGTFNFESPMLNVTADRSMPRGLATVQWDDEGVRPEAVPLVTGGVLQDYQTTREQAPWLASWYGQHGRAVRSHGYAGAESALHPTQQCTPNLIMTPGRESLRFEDLVASTKRGIAVMDGDAKTDFQCRSGAGGGTMREIVDGKLGAFLKFGGFLFDSAKLWKDLFAIGSADTTAVVSATNEKGQPEQTTAYSVSAVPGIIKNLSVIDITRKA